jgi:ketosteroid isomerase-like protein
MLANGKAKGSDRLRSSFVRHLIVCVTLMTLILTIKPAIAAPEDEVRATFDRFVVAQNAHDIKAVESLLLRSPDFLWITRGTPVWGHDAALKRFGALYDGTWRLDPESSALKITMIGEGVAQIYVPILFTIGAAGQPPQQTRFLMNQVLVKTSDGWRVSSVLPIPAPAP